MARRRVHVQPAPEAARADLKRVWPAVRAQRQRLAVQDQRPHRQASGHFDQLGYAAGDVVQAARKDADIGAEDVDLHPRTVELPFDRRGRGAPQGFGDALGRLGEHRLERLANLQSKRAQASGAVAQASLGHRAEIAPNHDRAAYIGKRNAHRARQRVLHHAFECALAELTHDQPPEKCLLFGCRACEQAHQVAAAFSLRVTAGELADGLQGGVDFHQAERGRLGWRRQIAHRRVAHADLALAQLAGQKRHADRRLRRLEPAQTFASRETFSPRAAVAPTATEVSTISLSRVAYGSPAAGSTDDRTAGDARIRASSGPM